MAGVAHANDGLVADGDVSDGIAVSGGGNPIPEALALGEFCAGDSLNPSSPNVNLVIVRGNNDNNRFANAATVTFTVQGIANVNAANGVVAATAPGNIVLSGWDSASTNTMSSPSSSTVSLTVPSDAVADDYSATVSYRGTGPEEGGTTNTVNHGLPVSWTVLESSDSACSTTSTVAPDVSYELNPATPDGNGGWYKTGPVTLTWTVTGTPTPTLTGCVDQTITADQAKTTYSCEATNSAGTDSESVEIGLDSTVPTVSFIGGPADGGSYYFGFVPEAPSCSAVDPTPGSGVAGSCSVIGYGTTVGSHTATGSQSDVAGNSGSTSASYTVLAWTPGGFYQPVDMDKLNIVKGGSTVPLKFEVFAGSNELTSTSVVDTFKAFKTNCQTAESLGTDEIEQYTSGATALRYDSTGGQFIQNWQVPKGAGICYHVVLTLDDGSTIEADFKSK